jgi:MscS family membrane protein
MFRTLLLIATLSIIPFTALGQEASPLEPADTSSPRATLTSFIDACNEIYNIIQREERGQIPRNDSDHTRISEKIFRCLDLSGQADFLKRYTAGEAAVSLKEVIDRIELPPLN